MQAQQLDAMLQDRGIAIQVVNIEVPSTILYSTVLHLHPQWQ